MIRLIQFEMKKLFRSNFFRIMLLAFCFFIVTYYVFVHLNTVRVEHLISEKEGDIHRNKEGMQRIKDSIDSSDGNAKRVLESDLEFWEDRNKDDENVLKAYQNEDWELLLNREIKRVNLNDLDMLVYKKEYFSTTWPTLFTRETLFEYQKRLLDSEIEPVLPFDKYAWVTIYDKFFISSGSQDDHLEGFVVKLSNKYSSTAIYYLHRLFLLLFGVFGAVFLLFLFGDIVTKEGMGRNGSINLLHTQPIQRGKILVSKLITMLILSIFILVGTSVISLALGTIFDSFGYWNYPVLIYGEDYSHSFMNMGTFIIKSALFFLMILLFCYSILFLYSVLTKRASTALGLTIVTFILGIKFSGESVLTNIAPYIPFHYFSVPKVMTMELAASFENFNFTFAKGLLALGISSIMIFIATYIISLVQYRYSS